MPVTELATSLWPLPGGADNYAETLLTFLRVIDETGSADEAVVLLRGEYSSIRSDAAVRQYLRNALRPLGLISYLGSKVALTGDGRAYLQTQDTAILRRNLLERVLGVPEILALVADQPLRIGVIHQRLLDQGAPWRTDWQIRYRLRWMEVAGLVTRRDYRADRKTSQRYPEYSAVAEAPAP